MKGVRRGGRRKESFLLLQSSVIMHFPEIECTVSMYSLISPLQCLVFLHAADILYIIL